MRTYALLFILFASVLGGCHSRPADDRASDATDAEQAQDTAFNFHPDQYAVVHDSIVAVLRDMGFRIAREDYRFGIITTFPKEAPTAAEFWIDDPTTARQHQSDTLNAQRRSVRVYVEPAQQGQPSYSLRVEVLIERLQLPARYLTHSATGQLSSEYAGVPMHLSDRGIDGLYPQPLDRDPYLEARISQAIRDQALAQVDPLR